MNKVFFIVKNLILFFSFTFFITLAVSFNETSASQGEMTFHAIYVGSGDALVINSGNHYMIVDSGPHESVNLVMDYLDSLEIPDKKIDYVVSTHPDGDHVGCFGEIFEEYEIGQVIYSPCTKANKSYASFIEHVKDEGCPFRNPIEGESWELGDANVTVIYDGSLGSTYNECSIVLKVTCGGKSILLTGDLPSTIESTLMTNGYNLQADVLKVGHHGAAASTSADFLDAVNPQYAVISSAKGSDAILPKPSVLKRLATRFIKTYRTSDKDVVINFKDGVISTNNKDNTGYISISKGTVTLSNNVFYATGKAITPSVSLIVNGQVIPQSQYTVKYKSNYHTGIGTVKITGSGDKYINSCSADFIILPKLETAKATLSSPNKVKLSWSNQKYATGYCIRYSTDKKFKKNVKYKIFSSAEKLSTTFSNLAFNKKYYYSVRAYKTNIGNGKWSKTLTVQTDKKPIPEKQVIDNFIKTSKSIKIFWLPVLDKYNAGYIVEYSKDKTFKKNVTQIIIKNPKQNYLSIKKSALKKLTYIRVKSFNDYGQGQWSNKLYYSKSKH